MYNGKSSQEGASFNGRTAVSKTANLGSIPSAPAISLLSIDLKYPSISMTEKVTQFPEGENWFVWRSASGELLKLLKGRYAITKDSDGTYREEYINPDLGKWENAVLEFEDAERIEIREIKSRKDYEEMLVRCRELNRNRT